MSRRHGSHRHEGDRSELGHEVVDLQPNEDASSPRDSTSASHVRRRRGPVVIAFVVVVAVVGSAIAGRSHHSNRDAGSPATTDARHTKIALDDRPGEGTALFPYRVGALVLTAGAEGLRIVDTDTGRVTTPQIDGLPLGPATIVAHSGETVAVRVDANLYWFSMQSPLARAVDAITAFPAERRGYLWLAWGSFAQLVPGAPAVDPTIGAAIGATRDGLLVVTKAGVLVQSTGGADNGSARLLVRAPATVIGVHPDRIAWVGNDCGVLRCPVHVTEIATGATSSWLQLDGHPSAVAGSSAVFSPDASHLAVVVPNESATRAARLIVADLRARTTEIVDTSGRIDEPAPPGSTDAAGLTLDWTADGRYLVLAPAIEAIDNRLAVVDPATPLTSRANLGVGTTVAAIGVSSTGPLDLPRHGTAGPIAAGGPEQLG